MNLEREKALKLVIVVLATLAALAVMSTLVQLIQTILPFLIAGAGIYFGYRWALGDAPAPSADEVEEQARGIFSRFRRTKQAVETTMKVGDALGGLAGEPEEQPEEQPKRGRRGRRANKARAGAKAAAAAEKADEAEPAEAAEEAANENDERAGKAGQVKEALESNSAGAIEFSDRDVVISADDVVKPDISRLEEKEKEVPEVTNNVLAQIEERRRRLEGGG